jgi:hypothetical protein
MALKEAELEKPIKVLKRAGQAVVMWMLLPPRMVWI